MKEKESKSGILYGLITGELKLCAPWRVVTPPGVWKSGSLLTCQRCFILDAQEQRFALGNSKPFIGLGYYYPPWPAQLGIYDLITLWSH